MALHTEANKINKFFVVWVVWRSFTFYQLVIAAMFLSYWAANSFFYKGFSKILAILFSSRIVELKFDQKNFRTKNKHSFAIPVFKIQWNGYLSIVSNWPSPLEGFFYQAAYKLTYTQLMFTTWLVNFFRIVSPWFFIGYWILKTGLDFYPGPFYFFAPP